ncbi:MAG: FAD-dependent oxidoreductase [Deltaproteobacteria bacterium]|nr:MAG: FAD-dependent oxidoreductase [Deltaproteobacteria bacterium]
MTESIHPAGLPIGDDDATIAAALEDVSIPTLMMSMIHMTGDTSLLRGPIRPAGIFLNEVQGFMSEDDKAAVRAQALEVIKAYRDGGCQLPPPPAPETIHAMMGFLVGGEVPAEYVPMMLEEMELDGRDARAFHWDCEVREAARRDFHVVVIGCGMSGLLAAIRLAEAGVSYTVIEKNPSVGGTWFENTYPGCRVDVGNHFYCYSFEPNPDWSEFFAQREELQAYFERCLEKYGVRERVRFETEVVAAQYDEAAARWSVRVRGREGREETLSANALVSAVGQLNRPKLPDIPGRDAFRGPSMHSAAWRHDVDLAGRRIAVIGTGASAFQIVPAIAEPAGRVTVFQRSAPWMFPNPNYHAKVGAGKKWALRHLPYYARWYRFLLFWPGCDGGLEAMTVDPDWPHPERSTSAMNEAARVTFTRYLEDQVGGDPELLAKVVPDYVCLGKRTLQDNGSWLAALKRDDVELVTDPIAEIREDSVVCESGAAYPVDVIVYATGFHANRFLWPMEITGRGGVKLREQWGDDPSAYLGITVPNFPNLFCIYGPGTNLAHGGSLIFHSECQVRYTLGCIKALLETGHDAIECRQEVHDAYDERLRRELERHVWSHPSIQSSWYKNRAGRVTVLSPWRLVDYWRWTRQPDLEDFHLR